MLSQRAGILVIGVLATATFWLCRRYFQLRGIPGPFTARITNLCRVRWVGSRKSHEIHSRLHDQYGSVGDFYQVFKSPDEPPDVFTAQNEGIHKNLRAPVAPYYSFSKLQSLERAIDNNIDRLFRQLDREDTEDKTSLITWLQAFAFDTVWAWMFTNPYGMLEMGSMAAKKTLESNWEIFQIIGPVTGIINAILTALKIDSIPQLHKHTVSLIKSREKQFESSSEELNASDNVDMITTLLLMKSKNSMIPPWTVSSLSLLNVFAGSDSTAVVMGTMWHNLLLHRDSMQCLYNELLQHEAQGLLTRPVPQWKEVQGLTYLDACLNEALRLHPPFCLPFERVVPDTGLSIGDYYLPPGTLVGMSPYVVGRYKPAFGQDADQWRPERWLECSPQDRRKMESSMITFGAGRRVCLGKNVAIMEIKKLIPALVLRYDIKLLDPAVFKVENSWFFKQEGLDVEMKKRDASV
ncbi:uncharacterized protein N7496_002396 [Penicillium cataractarum]|uniref:Cytochrome P450 n=1 Tax=Penicillium cataractarum TaxID=2100454 RepID=A0A9W9SK09_9EURO|nr:uncharacterized protein N7496_002396 [Penicillium cataractarum]KAJ5379968.1 hypothetical protein N7496_002396 [Penicillium cataractarum]